VILKIKDVYKMTCNECDNNRAEIMAFGGFMVLCDVDEEYHRKFDSCDEDTSVCKYCGMKGLVKHIIKEGSLIHVTSWDTKGSHCSDRKCKNNHGYGKCVPLKSGDVKYIPPMGKIL
jgi:hypothetical protein